MPVPRLTLCMIVRNEAAVLPEFIARVRGQVDEWIVIDTGSTDDTVHLLQEAGARVFFRAWDHDFSAARNTGLEKATGDWVLFLDPDEFVSPSFFSEARRVMEEPKAGAASVRMVNPLPNGHRRETHLLRLFRRADSVRFEHAIHEDISRSVKERLQEMGQELVRLSAPVEHVGYVREFAAARGKKDRDVGILKSCIGKNPFDFYSHFKLLEQARFWDDRALWATSAAHALSCLELAGPRCLSQAHFGGEFVALVSMGLSRPPAHSLALLDTWAPHLLPSAALRLRRGELLELLHRWPEARAEFQQCLEEDAHWGNLQLSSTRPLLGLARLALAEGRFEEALKHTEAALAHHPLDAEGLLAGATLSEALGKAAGLSAWKEKRVAQAGETPELFMALGEAAFCRGHLTEAFQAFEKAAELGAAPLGQVRAAQCLLALGKLEQALVLTESVSHTSADAALGLLLFRLVAGEDSSLDLEISQEAADNSLRMWLDALKKSAHSAFIDRFLKHSPALFEAFPWLPGWTESHLPAKPSPHPRESSP